MPGGGSIPPRKFILTGCNVNLVDGLIWSQEAGGSNPLTQTSYLLGYDVMVA